MNNDAKLKIAQLEMRLKDKDSEIEKWKRTTRAWKEWCAGDQELYRDAIKERDQSHEIVKYLIRLLKILWTGSMWSTKAHELVVEIKNNFPWVTNAFSSDAS